MVPKAQASFGDDEEKTTIESGWSEEPSTTVEQGEVAERIRALGIEPRRSNVTNVTSTNAGMLDEPTVDDQRANAALSMITATLQARLIVSGGNDVGQELLVQPGKTYTIGRAIDNDIVLTDIAVSRKHFDLRHEHASWVLIDRGSGNGTVVNGTIEDHPFTLATGDTIEIGNTSFRFEIPNGVPRVHQQSTFDASIDESVDGSLHQSMDGSLGGSLDDEEEPSTVAGKPIRSDEIATPAQLPPAASRRPMTMPPPAPRARTASQAPPPPLPSPAATMPTMPRMPQMQANGLPMPGGHQAPTMLGDARGLALPGALPSTLPGQGAHAPQQHPHFNSYPSASDLHNGHPGAQQHAHPGAQQHAHPGAQQMLVINGVPGRDATSTALVPPTPYGALPIHHPPQPAPPAYVAPELSRRTKLILGGAGLTLFAAIATIAIIKGSAGGKPPSTTPAPATESAPKQQTKATVSPIEEPTRPTPVTKVDGVKTTGKPPVVTKVEPAKVEPAKVEPAKVEPARVEPAKVARVEPKKKDPPKKDPPRKDPPKKDPPRKDPPKKDPPKRVAVVDNNSGNLDAAKSKASSQFSSKNFNGAASTLRAAAAGASSEDARDLKSLAAVYQQFGKFYNTGMAPNTPAKQAWSDLSRAKSFDRDGVFTSEINQQRGKIASKAAVAFMASKDYTSARQAVVFAESSGNTSGTTTSVRSDLERRAAELFKQAKAEAASDPDAAKQKYRQIQNMVDSKNQWHQRAGKELSGG